MFCAISGQIPVNPVISVKSGYLFERSLIEKQIEAENRCPITGEPLTKEDLIPVKLNKAVNPRTTAEGSIPGMLKAFQNEWDALMMESFTLKKHLENVRQELSQALYQYDAACRVIARLIKERDEARQQLANLHATGVSSSNNMEEEGEEGAETGINKKIQQEVNDLSKQLFETRKNRKIPESLETIENLKEFKCLNSYAIHKSNKIGITCIDINPHNDNEILTGGIDHEIKLFDKSEGKVITTLKGHTKQLTDVLFALNNIILSSSSDKTIRIWTPTEKSTYKSNILACHTDEVYGLTIHPLQRYFVSNSKDNSWCFNDIENIKCISKFENNNGDNNDNLLYSSLSSPMFHPDGVLLAIGYTTGKSCIFDIRKQGIVATFEGHNKDITGITFSENGYHMFTGSLDGTAKLWDLRKCQVIQTVSGEGEVTAVKYDRSGEYLLIGGNDVRLFKVNGSNKKDEICKIVKTFDDNTKPITGLAFGNDCKYIATTSLDKNLRLYSV